MNNKFTRMIIRQGGRLAAILAILSMLIPAIGARPVQAISYAWTAYNDSSFVSGDPSSNITQFTISGTTSGLLKKYSDNTNTSVTATFTTSGQMTKQTSGAEAGSSTDAYTTFNGKASTQGIIGCASQYSCVSTDTNWIDLTFTGLDPTKTYTFATTTVRNGGTSYNTRDSKFTISDISSATNASTSGVTAINNETVWFTTGTNQTQGYVARWTGINPGSDGDFKVRAERQNTSEFQFYGQSVFSLAEDVSSTSPTINISGSLSAFNSQPGVVSAEQNYNVSGSNLTADIVITAPVDFEISTTSGSGFGSTLNLVQSSGSVASTPIYVRFNRATAGTTSGNITHTSTGATTANQAVTGTAAVTGAWTAYNDSATPFPSPQGNITEFSISGTTSGLLKRYSDGTNTAVTATFTTSGNLTNSTGNGAAPASGTDAYNTFNGKVNMAGVVACTDQSSPACADNTWYIDLTFTGLDPAKTYTFATTTVRDGGSTYADRNALFTISDMTSATNASTSGVTVVSNESVWFNAGTNQTEGYVARWTGINPGADGDFKVRAQPQGSQFMGYGQSVFMLSEEGALGPTISTSGSLSAFASTPGNPSSQQSYTVSGSNLSDDITITPPADFELSLTSGSGFGTTPLVLTQSGGTVASTPIYVRFNRATNGTSSGNIVHTSSSASTVNVAVSGTASTTNLAPNAPVLVSPVDNATGVAMPPALEVTVSDPNAGGTLDVTFYGRAVGGGGTPGADFRLVVIPDSQNESASLPAAFTSQTQWVVNNKTSQNIVFLTHVGDLVNTATTTSEWVNADAAFDLLDPAGVPYSVGPGNHDGTGSGMYETYFGVSRFTGKSWYGGNYGSNNMNNYSLFSASGLDFILINLQYNPTTAMIDWANNLLQTNPNRRGIVEQHDILNTDNSWANQTSYNTLRSNANLFLMLCGHTHAVSDGAAYVAGTGTDGHTIHVVMQDYQDFTSGNGYLRIYRFSPVSNMIYMTTYSPYASTSITTSPDQMDLAYTMSGSSGPFTVIGNANGIANGSNASISWSGLTSGTEYEWYAVVSDGSLSTTGATWSFTPSSAVANPPVITEGTSVPVSMSEDGNPTAFSLTLNATDVDTTGSNLSWSISTPAGNGTAGASGTGNSKAISYTPTANYNGSDTFVVQVSDGSLTDTITVNVTITAQNDPPVITEGTSVLVGMSEDGNPTAFSLTLNATDIDTSGSTLTWSIFTPAVNGTAGASGTGNSKAITYTPTANYNGSDSFVVRVSDGSGGTDTITVNVSISAQNDPPVITEGTSVPVSMSEDGNPTVFNLTLNATDIDTSGSNLTWSISTPAGNGAALASGTGNSKAITYTPISNYYGSDTFVVQVSDGSGGIDTITVNLTISAVNDAPMAIAQSVATNEDIALPITLSGSDVEGSGLTYAIETSPTHGLLSGSAPSLIYTPTSNYFGPDSFTFKVNDGSINSSPATITITVNPVNDAPVAYAQSLSIVKDVAKSITLTGSDVEGSPLTYSIETGPSHGLLSGSAPGVTYTPTSGYTGMDSFTYKVNDGILDSIAATINIEVAESSAPTLPSSFYGEIHFYDGAPSAGQLVETSIPGVTGTAASVAIQGTSLLTYAFNVPGDLPITVTKEGGLEGDVITFTIASRVVATAIWHGGTNAALNLHPPQALPGGPYSGVVGVPINFSASANDYGSDASTYEWDWDNDGAFDTSAQTPSHIFAAAGMYTVNLKVSDIQGGTGTATVTVEVFGKHSISLVEGWNLVSFNLHPADTSIAAVLASIDGNYSLVYAWDASGVHSGDGNWMKYDPAMGYGNTLTSLDINQGFWIQVNSADTLEVAGTMPVTTNLALSTSTNGWNLIGYPSSVNRGLPSAFSSHGVGTDFEIVYAYHASDISDPWKMYDRSGASYANDLLELSPGWGYWIKVTVPHTWDVKYLAD